MERLKFSGFIACLFLLWATLSSAWGATYYLAPSPTGNDNHPGTDSAPWATFAKAFSVMAGGDTLLVADGTYNQKLGQWKWQNGVKVPTIAPPSGTASQYTTVKAQNVRATVNGIQIISSSYIRIEGFKSLGKIDIDGCRYIEFRKIAAKGGIATARSSYVLKEDVWAWNNNRYTIHNYQSDHVIDHRVISRLDDLGTPPSLPVGAISHYLTNYSVIAHALLFDVSGTFSQPYDLVYSSRPGTGYNQLWGVIGFDAGSQLGGIYPADGNGSNYEIRNSVIWGTTKRCFRFNASSPLKVIDSTCGQNGGNAVESNGSVEIKNNIFFNNGGGVSAPVSSCDNNLFYNSGSAPGNCTNTQTIYPPIQWLPRSPIPGKGANIENRYAISLVNGIFAVQETTQNLWPWPYEDLIRADLCEGTTKGWCGTNKTLTQYIWEYLGSPIPPEIYGGGEGDSAPPVISQVGSSSLTPSSATISWNTDEPAAGHVEYGPTDAYGNSTPPEGALTTSHAIILSGLSANTTYFYRVRARDAAGNEAVSGAATFTTLADLPPADMTPPGGVTSFSATATDQQVSLSWVNPGDGDFVGTQIRYRTDTYPTGPQDGTQVCNRPAAAGSQDGFLHTGLQNGATYYYAAFSYDPIPNYAAATAASATPMAVAPPPGGPPTYYVAPGGNDASPGSQSQPWATLQHAANVVKPGDLVLVLDGTYQPFHVTRAGTATDRITFRAQGEKVYIPGYESFDGRYTAVSILGDYVTLEGFKINVGATDGMVKSRGIRISGDATVHRRGVIVRHNTVANAGWVGITTSFAEGVVLEDNEVWGSKGQHGIYVANSADNPIVRGNIVHDNPQAGIQLNADLSLGGDGKISGALIENNILYNNGTACCGAIELDGVIFSTIRNNLLYNNRTSGINNYKGDGAEASHDNKILNNTIIMPSGSRHAIALRNGSVNAEIKNNILLNLGTGDSLAVDTASLSGLRSDYNVLTRVESPSGSLLSLSQWQSGYSQDMSSRTATQSDLFVNPTVGDYHLRAGSPAIDTGVALTNVPMDMEGTTRPQGSQYDLGAYESAGGTPPPPQDTVPPSPPTGLRIVQ